MGHKQSSPTNNYYDRWDIGTTSQPLPTHKLRIPVNIASMEERPCVIFYNGTFAPVHYGHVDALLVAKEYLQQRGFHVMGAYMSPCWNGYCYSKMRTKRMPYVSHAHRLNMLHLAVASLDFVMVDLNEIFANHFIYPTATILQFYQRVLDETRLKKGQFDVVWLFGADLGTAMIPPTHTAFLRTLCIDNRDDDAKRQQQLMQRVEQLNAKDVGNIPLSSGASLPVHHYHKAKPLQLSSTQIRALCSANAREQLLAMFAPHNLENVALYMLDHRIYAEKSPNLETDEKKYEQDLKAKEKISAFRQRLVTESVLLFEKHPLNEVLNASILTAYLRDGRGSYLESDEEIVSYEYERPGANGFRGKGYRLFGFKTTTGATKNWRFYLKVVSQNIQCVDAWLLENEHTFYQRRFAEYSDSFCTMPALIFSDLVRDKERVVNMVCSQDVTETVTFPKWHEPLATSKLILIVRSLAEFHAKSFLCDARDALDASYIRCTDERYLQWISKMGETGQRLFRSSHSNLQILDESHIQFIDTVCTDCRSIIGGTLSTLMKETDFMCLVHGDAFISNVLLPNDEEKKSEERINETFGVIPYDAHLHKLRRCILIDWQTCVVGCPFVDIISVFDSLLIDVGSDTEQQLFVCYLDYLCRFGVKLKGLNTQRGSNPFSNKANTSVYYQMYFLCHIWSFLMESGFWTQYFFSKPNKKQSKNDERGQRVLKIQSYMRRRLDVLQKFYQTHVQNNETVEGLEAETSAPH